MAEGLSGMFLKEGEEGPGDRPRSKFKDCAVPLLERCPQQFIHSPKSQKIPYLMLTLVAIFRWMKLSLLVCNLLIWYREVKLTSAKHCLKTRMFFQRTILVPQLGR